ncbi:hypothetical protein D3C76_1834390 [compost metagenome]
MRIRLDQSGLLQQTLDNGRYFRSGDGRLRCQHIAVSAGDEACLNACGDAVIRPFRGIGRIQISGKHIGL